MPVLDHLVVQNIEDPGSKLIPMIKRTSGKTKHLVSVSICFNLPRETWYKTALKLLRIWYGDPHQLLVFLIKFQNVTSSSKWNIVSVPDILCMLVSKLPVNFPRGLIKRAYNLIQDQLKQPELSDSI